MESIGRRWYYLNWGGSNRTRVRVRVVVRQECYPKLYTSTVSLWQELHNFLNFVSPVWNKMDANNDNAHTKWLRPGAERSHKSTVAHIYLAAGQHSLPVWCSLRIRRIACTIGSVGGVQLNDVIYKPKHGSSSTMATGYRCMHRGAPWGNGAIMNRKYINGAERCMLSL